MDIAERDAVDLPKAVVVHAANRDYYQLARALHEDNLLQALVTDIYWPADRDWFNHSLSPLLSAAQIARRYCPSLGSHKTLVVPSAAAAAVAAATLLKNTPNQGLHRYKDRMLGRTARRVAWREQAVLFCCSYYAFEAFRSGPQRSRYRFIFQLQADPVARRQLLLGELDRTPFAWRSLRAAYELNLSGQELINFNAENVLANGWVAPSTYAAQTLLHRGIDLRRVHVVPYGVDSETFRPRVKPPAQGSLFRVVFAGRLQQDKGLSYLLEAMRRLKSRRVELILYTGSWVDQDLLAHFADVPMRIKTGLSGQALASELQQADVFVFPSLTEGFGHVILEAMACGLPVIATDHTAGPDVLADGVHGFIVPIRDAAALAEKIAWGIENRAELADMGAAAARQARLFTWERFRRGIRSAYLKMIEAVNRDGDLVA